MPTNTFDTARLGYLGQKSDHCDNLVRLMSSLGKEIHIMEDSWNRSLHNPASALFGTGSAAGVCRRILRPYSQVYGILSSYYRDDLISFLDTYDIHCLLAYWGINPLADIVTIKKQRPTTKVILNVLCHPTGLSRLKISAQNWLLRRSVEYIDGLVFSSDSMRRYFDENILHGKSIPFVVLSPLLSKYYRPHERLPPCEHAPNLVFLGRMDWSAGQPTDNVGDILERMLDCGIHIYHSGTKEPVPSHPNRHVFTAKPLTDLGIYSTQFDASLMAYNLDTCPKDDRFRVTIPDRLIASVAFGIPVAIPKMGFEACKEFLRAYGATIEYASPRELFAQLSDRTNVHALRTLAVTNSRRYIGEAHLNELMDFISLVLHS